MTYRNYLLVTLTFLLFSGITHADLSQRYDHISLQTSASTDIKNDVLVAILMVQEQGLNPANLADRVNHKMADILNKVSHFNEITSHTTSYNTHPIYKNGQIQSWQVNQQIKLISQNFEQLGRLVADVNKLATVQSMSFSISDQRIDTIKQELTKEAISKFREKATLIANQFGKPNYRIVQVSIDSNQNLPQPMMERSMMMADSRGAAPPALAAGTNKISVNIVGTIELVGGN